MEEFKEMNEMDSLYEETIKPLHPGDIVKGTVVSVSDKEVMVDVGYKAEGVIPISEFKEPPQVGDEIEVFVRSLAGESGIQLSKKEADKRRQWRDILKAKEEGTYVKGVITKRVKGGYRVKIGEYEAFLPMSQADVKPIDDPDSLVGVESYFKVLDAKLEGKNPNIVVSRKEYLREELEREKEEFWSRMVEGKVIEGQVKKVMDYGAFINVGPVDGLLHINDISWKRIKHPSEVLREGQRVWVKVLSFDREKEKISLGMKQLTPDPWENIEEKYPVGSRVKGKVSGITDYGAFVELEEGVEGLIHISEFSWTKRIKHPSEVLKEGDEVECVVIDIKPDERRLSLSLKRVEENPWENVEEKYPVGAVVSAKVKKILANRVIVELEEGVEAFINADDLTWSKRLKKPSDILQVGDELKVKILEVDGKRRRIRAGLKQIMPDPWQEFVSKYKEGDVVKGEVTSVTPFGAFVKLTDEVEGLVHVSQLDDKKVKAPEDVVKVGDILTAVITKIDNENRKVSLSVKEYKLMKEKEEVEKMMSSSSSSGDSVFKLGDILKKAIEKSE
ncbi:MAG: 30S ribosomal protein S1 [Deferribacteres bacterium]|nr:30S ribosomal protein S1 [Deferribacteres bacterium]